VRKESESQEPDTCKVNRLCEERGDESPEKEIERIEDTFERL